MKTGYLLKIEDRTIHMAPDLIRDFEPFARRDAFVVTTSLDRAISIYPENKWNKIVTKILQMPALDPRLRGIKRTLISHAVTLRLDPENKVEISRSLMDYAGIQEKAVAIVFADKLEIWNPLVLKRLGLL